MNGFKNSVIIENFPIYAKIDTISNLNFISSEFFSRNVQKFVNCRFLSQTYVSAIGKWQILVSGVRARIVFITMPNLDDPCILCMKVVGKFSN